MALGCLPNWANTCSSGGDCCSGRCDNNNGQWQYGVCKPSKKKRESKDGSGCHELWFNKCKDDSDCCSGYCDTRDGYWLDGVCKPANNRRRRNVEVAQKNILSAITI